MSFFTPCEKCGKKRFRVIKRSFLVPKVSPKPIVTTTEICGKCYRRLAKTVYKT